MFGSKRVKNTFVHSRAARTTRKPTPPLLRTLGAIAQLLSGSELTATGQQQHGDGSQVCDLHLTCTPANVSVRIHIYGVYARDV